MKMMTYLLNLRISGIKNIEKEIYISFFGKSINKSFNPEKYKIKGIYGENGSGKSAIITAVEIVKEFIFDDNYLRDSHKQLLLKELINKKSNELYFRCEFVTNIETRYIFEYEVKLVIDNNSNEINVANESLKYKINSSENKQRTIFNCAFGEFLELNLDEDLNQIIKLKTLNLLIKQSALGTVFFIIGKDDKHRMPKQWLYSVIFFLSLFAFCDKGDTHRDYYNKRRIEGLKKSNHSSEVLLKELWNSINTFDSKISISDYSAYEKKVKRLEKFVRLFKPDLKKIDIEKKENNGFYECELLFDYGDYRVNKEFESTGIKKIIDIYYALVLASNGAIVFIDELDSNINDIYLCKIIEYFVLYGEGQLCFTSHNTDPMLVLKDNNKSIDFISRDNLIVPWVKNGHYSADSSYKNGMIMGLPFNIDSSDFIGVFVGEE